VQDAGLKSHPDDATICAILPVLSDTLLERESWGLIAAVLGNAIIVAGFGKILVG